MSRSSTQSNFQQAPGRPRPRPAPSGRADTRRSRGGSEAPRRAPGRRPRRSGRSCPRRSARRALSGCRLASVSPPRAPAGHIAPRRQPVPELVEVPLQVPLKLRDRLLINAGRALVGLDPQPGLPNGPLRDIKRLRLRLAHPAPPTRRRLTAKPARTTRPLRSSPITGPSPLTTRRSAPVPRTGTQPLAVPAAWGSPVRDRPRANTAPLARSPCRGDRFPRSMQEPRPRSRHLHAGHHLANQQAPARLIPELQSIPGFDVNLFLRHVISGSLTLVSVTHT